MALVNVSETDFALRLAQVGRRLHCIATNVQDVTCAGNSEISEIEFFHFVYLTEVAEISSTCALCPKSVMGGGMNQ